MKQQHRIKSLIPNYFPKETFSSQSASQICSNIIDLVSTGHYKQALSHFKHLHCSSVLSFIIITPILSSLIKASAHSPSLHVGFHLHCLTLKTAADSDVVVSNSLISLYAKFARVVTARQVFDKMPQRDIVSWNSLINCYVQNGCYAKALDSFKGMCARGYIPKPELTAGILSMCSREGDLRLGREIHGFVTVSGMIHGSVLLPTAMVDLYAKNGELCMAVRVFEQIGEANAVSWTALISGYIACHEHEMALDCFRRMQAQGIQPNRVTLISIMPACAELRLTDRGKEIHGFALRHGFESELCFSAALMNMYCRFGGARALYTASKIIGRSKETDIVMWGSIITRYAKEGKITEAAKFFKHMQLTGIKPNSVTLLAMISACAIQPNPSGGREIHSYALRSGLIFDICVGNSLITMYANCGFLANSSQVFAEMPVTDCVSWSALIGAHGITGHGKEALQLFHDMQNRGLEVDSITLLSTLAACSHAGLVEEGQKLLKNAVEEKKIPLSIEHYACQIDLLSRAGKVEEAAEIVRQMPFKASTRIWSSLVSFCKDHGRLEVAERLAHELIEMEPDNATNYTLLSAVYAKSDDWRSVEQVWRLMRAKGVKKRRGFSRVEL